MVFLWYMYTVDNRAGLYPSPLVSVLTWDKKKKGFMRLFMWTLSAKYSYRLCHAYLSLNDRKRVQKCYTGPVLLYGIELLRRQ